MIVSKDLSLGSKFRKVFKNIFFTKCDFRLKNIKETQSPKMPSNVLYEFPIRIISNLSFFHKLQKLHVEKKSCVNGKTKIMKKLILSGRRIQNFTIQK